MATLLTQHNRQSFDSFIEHDIGRIFQSKNPIRILKNKDTNGEYRTKVYFFYGGRDGSSFKYISPTQSPLDCRLDGLTYDGELKVDVDIIVEHDKEANPVSYTQTLSLVDLPTMLHSKRCTLHGLSPEDLCSKGESIHERGGYFIVKGLEKVILSQEDSANNTIYTREDNSTKNLIATIQSQHGSNAPEKFELTYDAKTSTINATIQYFRGSIPLVLLLRALGMESDKQILSVIIGNDMNSETSKMMMEVLLPSFRNAQDIFTQNIAMKALSLITKSQANLSGPEEKWKGNLLYLLSRRLLPHIATDDDDYTGSLKTKATYLGYMVRQLVLTKLGLLKLTDRDSLMIKKVRLPGEIMRDMFREFYEDYVTEVKRKTDRMIELDKKADMSGMSIMKDILEYGTNNFSSNEFQRSINKSFMGKWGRVPSSPRNEGVLQTYMRHSFMEAMSHLRRVHLHLSDGPNTMEQRRLHNSQWGYFCPVETPDGGSIGQHKHLAQTCTITEEGDPSMLVDWIKKTRGFVEHDDVEYGYYDTEVHNVFVNGVWLGMQSNPPLFVAKFKEKRINKNDTDIHWSFSICWDIKNCDIRMFTTGGRLTRPLKIKGKPQLSDDIELLGCVPEILMENGCEYIDTNESDTILVGWNDEDNCTHVEITKTSMFGLSALTLPYIEYNPIARNLYATQQARAAVSVYASNYLHRMDQKASLLHYGQSPLVHTGVVKKLNNNEVPYGINLIVAIAACNGYNQEDAIIINKSAIESGMFVSSYLTTHSIREDISQSRGENSTGLSNAGDIKIVNPLNAKKEILRMKREWDYSLLDENGIIKKGNKITSNTVLIGAYTIDKNGDWIDNSIVAKNAHKGETVTKVHLSKKSPRIGKVVTREIRFPIVGDKFASRAAQKAVLGIIVPKENMPYTEDGVVPDIIFNPHSFPSRMTIAYFLEMLTGQVGISSGRLVEVPNFNSVPDVHETLMKTLKDLDSNPNSELKLYSGTSGKLICDRACLGPVFYQRLKQMVGDKMYARGGDGPVDAITKQPLGGRARGGGLKSGEMERDALLSHGMSQFVKEMYWDKSDAYEMTVDAKTGNIVPHNVGKDVIHNGEIRNVQVPYGFKLLLQELRAMGISSKIHTKD